MKKAGMSFLSVLFTLGVLVSNAWDEIQEAIQDYKEALGIFKRFKDHLAANGVGFKKIPAVLDPWLEMDSAKKNSAASISSV